MDKDDNLIDWRLEYVSEKDLNRGGKFINIVSTGDKDIKAWNNIPDDQKQQIYDKYANWVNAPGHFDERKHKGFYYYYKILKKAKW